MKILIAADGSEHTKRMLAYMTQHAWLAHGNEITVLTVVGEVPGRAASFVDAGVVKDYYEEEAEKVLAPVRAYFTDKGLNAQFVHKTGQAAEVIAQEADKGYDLLALGSHGHGALANLIMGSVATKTLSLCKVPVLLLR